MGDQVVDEMRYLLDQDEYEALVKLGERRRDALQDTLQDLCTKVADHMPVKLSWSDKPPRPWGCILSGNGNSYCDECPVREVCPHPHKEYSK